MERASRFTIVASIVLAGCVHAWLASARPGLAPAAGVAFVLTFLVARRSAEFAIAGVLSLTYLAPALTYVAFGVSDYHTTLVWLAALAGTVCAQADLDGWHLPARWKFPFVTWGLVLAISWPIVAARELDFSPIAARSETPSGLFHQPPRLAAAWVVLVALAQMIGILWFDLLWARLAKAADALRRFERLVILPLAASAAAGALVGLYQGLVDITFWNIRFWQQVERAGGLMLDANTFAIGAAIWGPATLALTWRLGRGVWLGACVYVLSFLSMWNTGSRSALVAVAVATTGVLIGYAQRRGAWHARLVPLAALIGGALLILIVTVAPRDTAVGSPLKRIVDRLPTLEAGDLRRFADEVLWTRFGYGTAAAEIVAEHPVSGVGAGAFHIIGIEYIYRDSGHPRDSDNAQNWWRHQLAELGIVGALPALWISIVVLYVVFWGRSSAEPPGVGQVLRGILAGVGLASVFGVPTQHPATWLSFVTLLFWLDAMRLGAWEDAVRLGRSSWLVAWGTALAVGSGLLLSARSELRVPHRALRTEVPFSYGLGPVESVTQFGELRWVARRAVTVIPVRNPWLQLTVLSPFEDTSSNPVVLAASMNGRALVPSITIDTREPLPLFIRMPAGPQQWAFIELEVSREVGRDRALQVAWDWKPQVPPGTPAERILH